jgi:hypothetical protein
MGARAGTLSGAIAALDRLASRKGFEPLTYGLGNRCSILLSYRELAAVSCPAGVSPAGQENE